MNRKRFVTTILAIVLVFSILPHTPAAASAIPSSWAIPEMNDANTSGLLTPSAAFDFHKPLTRDEFCELIVKMTERTLGRNLPIPSTNPFTDSDSVYVQKANLYGIIYGVGEGKFNPGGQVERQQLCAMMDRAITKLQADMGRAFLKPAASTLPFKDTGKIDAYAVNSVKTAYSNEIMLGDDQNSFNPKSGVTSEECVAVIIRAFNTMQNSLIELRSGAQLADMFYERLEIGFAYGDTEYGVSKNVVLPTTVSGGATIKWTSSNESVISTSGAVNITGAPITVKLTADITAGGGKRTKEFTLRTTPFTGDRLLIENAYNALDVVYTREGDGPDSVTGRVCLPDSVLNIPVSWSTSNSSIITRTGQVSTPSGNDVRVVSLTATLMKGAQARTKTFTLRVTNPAYSNRSVSLTGIELGMTQAQVSTTLGSPRRSIQTTTSELWSVYHDNYNNFTAVAFNGNRAIAVYSMVSGVTNQLKDASKSVVTAEQVNLQNNVHAVQYADAGNVYAILLYDMASAIEKERTLYSEGQEQLLLDFINAFRRRNSTEPMEWNAKLAASARTHSTEMGNYNFLSATSRNGYSFLDRAVTQGYESKLFIGGSVLGGPIDAVNALNQIVSTTTARTDMLSKTATVFGAGFTGGYNGQYKTYLTCTYGSLKAITGVTTNPVTISLSAGKSEKVTLNIAPTGYNESIRWTSSNSNIFTLSGTEGDKAPTVNAVSSGNAYIYVTGVSSGNSYTIPVSVGVSYATDLKLSSGSVSLTNDSTALLGEGESLQLSATVTPAGSVVSWSSSNTNIATVSSQGLVAAKPGAVGTVSITASVNTSSTQTISRILTVHVDNISLKHNGVTLQPGGNITLSLDSSGALTTTVVPSAVLTSDAVFNWTSSNSNVVKVTDGLITAVNTGPAVITVTATRPGIATGSISKSFNVTVSATAYATDLKLTPTTLELEIGQSRRIETTVIPAVVEKNIITWNCVDTDIATVDSNGIITAKKVGTTTIYATMERSGAPLIKSVELKVLPNTVPVQSITISGPTSAKVGDTLTYSFTLTPSNATANVHWSTSDSALASVDSATGKVNFHKPGTVILTAYSSSVYATYAIIIS